MIDFIQNKALNLQRALRCDIINYIGLIVFFIVLIWFYHIPPWMWNAFVPEYGDTLEALWCIEIWREAILKGDYSLINISAMYPLGLHYATVAHFGVGFLALPISIITNSVLSLNIMHFAGLIMCFFGSRYFLMQIIPNKLLVSVGATIFTFALGRTVHIYGHWHMSLASAFSIWMAGLLLRLRHAAQTPSAWRHALASGFVWGAAVIAQPYSLFHNIPLLLLLGKQRKAWQYIPIIGIVAFTVCAPYIFLNWQGSRYMSSLSPSLAEVAQFQSSLTSYFGWGNYTYWQTLKDLTRSWRPVLPEQNSQNWGVLTIPLSLVGIAMVLKNKKRRSILSLFIIALLLSLGPLLKISPYGSQILQTLSDSVYDFGKILKPLFFNEYSLDLKNKSVPSPVMITYLLIPRYEYVRVSGRFAIWVGLAAVALGLIALRQTSLRVSIILSCIWLIELLPKPLTAQPAPVEAHPAHQWVTEQLIGQQDRGVYNLSGVAAVYSQRLAGEVPSTGTFGSFAPAYTRYTHPWILFAHDPYDPPEIALTEPVHARILRRAQVGIVLLRPPAAELAKRNSALRFIQCFEPEGAKSYLPTRLCAFEVLEGEDDFFNIQPLSGFSYFEPNLDFIWIEGTHAQAGWRITKPVTHTIALTLRAYCPDGRQTVRLHLNKRPLATHTWTGNCWEPWSTTLTIPPEHLHAGLNRLEFEANSAAQLSLHDPNSQDQRRLSVGVERLRVMKAAASEALRPGEAQLLTR